MRRRTVPAVLVAGAMVFAGGCGLLGGDAAGDHAGNVGSESKAPSASASGEATPGGPARGSEAVAPRVTVTPKDGTTGVALAEELVFAVEGGRLGRVEVVNASGERVDGTLASDAGSWKPKVPFTPAGSYTINATATDPNGQPTTVTTTFRTEALGNEVTATVFPYEGTVGVGQPVSVRFDRPITDKAAAEKAIKVKASPAVSGAWHWFGDTRVEWRPKRYWKPGTRVTVDMHLRGADLGRGTASKQYKSFDFAISRVARISVVDTAAHTMTTSENGRVVKTTDITAGESPEYDTWGGVMVVMEKYATTRMNSQTVGLGKEYDIAKVPWAVRLTTSGTFAHGNFWYDKADPPFGRANTSHGCVSMTPDDAKWFYDRATPGDIVKVINTRERAVSADNGYGAWNLSWDEWTAG